MRNLSKTALLILMALQPGTAYGQEEAIQPQGSSVFGNFFSVFQANSPLVGPDGTQEEFHPFYQYLEITASNPGKGLSFYGYLRANEMISGKEENELDAYNAYLRYIDSSGTLDVRLGRQTLTEGTNYYLLDGGLVRLRLIENIDLVAYGGYQGQNSQPDPENLPESSALFGIKFKFYDLYGANFSAGYEGVNSVDFPRRDFLHLTLNRTVPFTEAADVYSRGEIDLGEGSLVLFTAGMGMNPSRSLYLNLEYDLYEPDDDQGDFLQDRIFDIFSVDRLHQAKGGLTYLVSGFLKSTASYSYIRYEVLDGVTASGHIGRLGFSWDFWRQWGFRAFQGLYWLEGRGEDRALGINLGVSEELVRGLELQYSFAYVHTETITQKEGNAFSHIMGIQYQIVRTLSVKAELELNSNPDFERDTRVNLGLNYHFYF